METQRGIMLVSGDPGLGKTTALQVLLPQTRIPARYVELRVAARGLSVMRSVVTALGGVPPTRGDELVEFACELVANRRLLLVVDEAHQMNLEAMQAFRYLWDRPDSDFGLVLSGKTFRGLRTKAPELDSRVSRRVMFEPLKGGDLLSALRKLHPLLGGAPVDLLREIDRQYPKGELRLWVHLLGHAVPFAEAAGVGTLDERIARLVLTKVQGNV
jgi:type II secretory pathway predicted ATPase ExeA